MKQMVLIFNLLAFVATIVFGWLINWIYGIGFTLAAGVCIVLTIMLLRKWRSVRWWVVVLMLIFALAFLSNAIAAFVATRVHNSVDIITSEESEEFDEEICEEVADETTNDKKGEVSSDNIEDAKQDDGKNYVQIVEKQVPVTVEKIIEKKVEAPVTVEKIIEKKVEVPVTVEKIVEKEVPVEKIEYVEVPVVEYVEVPAPTIEPEDVKPLTPPSITVPQYNYTGDPTVTNYGCGNNYYGYDYTGDPTVPNYDYGYNYGYQSVTISGPTTVEQGESATYTISGVSSVSLSKLEVPNNVYAEKLSGNRVRLTFEEGWTGIYSIGYGSSTITVRVEE